MQIKIFTIPISDNGTMLDEMNRFLRSKKVLEVQSELIGNTNGASWFFCIRHLESQFTPAATVIPANAGISCNHSANYMF